DLACPWPICALSYRIAQQPEGRPEALLVLYVVIPEPNFCLCDSEAPLFGRECVLGLHTGRRPTIAVAPGNDLESLTTAVLEVAVRGGVLLELVVDADIR